MHDSRLDADGLVVDLLDVVHVPGEIDDQAVSQRFPRHARSRAAGNERDPLLVGVPGQRDHIVAVAGKRHGERRKLVQAAVGCVERIGQAVAANFAAKRTRQVFQQARLSNVHPEIPGVEVRTQRHEQRPPSHSSGTDLQ
jgi:hypothetical protein